MRIHITALGPYRYLHNKDFFWPHLEITDLFTGRKFVAHTKSCYYCRETNSSGDQEQSQARQRWSIISLVKHADTKADETAKKEKLKVTTTVISLVKHADTKADETAKKEKLKVTTTVISLVKHADTKADETAKKEKLKVTDISTPS